MIPNFRNLHYDIRLKHLISQNLQVRDVSVIKFKCIRFIMVLMTIILKNYWKCSIYPSEATTLTYLSRFLDQMSESVYSINVSEMNGMLLQGKSFRRYPIIA